MLNLQRPYVNSRIKSQVMVTLSTVRRQSVQVSIHS